MFQGGIKLVYKRDENYCSYSPEELFGVRFNYGCYLHDRQYRDEVINRKTRLEADKHLRDVIYRAFVVADKKFCGFIISRIYFLAVRCFGWRAWHKRKV